MPLDVGGGYELKVARLDTVGRGELALECLRRDDGSCSLGFGAGGGRVSEGRGGEGWRSSYRVW